MIYFQKGSKDYFFSEEELKESVIGTLKNLGNKKKILVIPPDFTRKHSFAGLITEYIYRHYGNNLTDILPALGTHKPMTKDEISEMFNSVPEKLFREHNWRDDIVTLGEVPPEYIYEVSEQKLNFSWPAQVNKLIVNGGFDLILSIGQVVPHEVIGMANFNKNIFVGTGGAEGINKSHFLGAVYGIERILGRDDNPVRKVLNYASEKYLSSLPIIYIQTVVSKNADGKLKVNGLYIGDDSECFKEAAKLSLSVNFNMLDKALKKVVVYLDPSEFKSTWLGNKSIYRTRMAMEDEGELIILAPGVKEFGEDKKIDELIRKYGYLTTPEILDLVDKEPELQNNLSAAAHLIHGSSENRFKITYCPGHLSKEEIESVNFSFEDINQLIKLYDPGYLKEGFNKFPCGTEVFYISNPALGLWAYKSKFEE